MLRYYETDRFTMPPDPEVVARHTAILEKYGLKRTDRVLWNYDINIEVVPFK